MESLEKKMKEGKERCFGSGGDRSGKSNEPSFNEILIANEEPTGTSEKDTGKEKAYCWQEEGHNVISLDLEYNNEEGELGHNRKDIHAILKETMAGSMREVIKDELQAWLGLKSIGQGVEGDQNGNDQDYGNMVDDKEEGEVGGATSFEEVSPINGGAEEDRNMMISPMKEIVEEEEREARKGRDRRTSARQAHQRQSKGYESDTVARATKRKECLEDKGTPGDIFSIFDIIPVHLIVHIAKSCGMEVDLGEHDLEDLIISTKERRRESPLS